MIIVRRTWSFFIIIIHLALMSITGILVSILWPFIQLPLMAIILIFDKNKLKADEKFVIPNKADLKQYRQSIGNILEGLSIYK